MEAIIEFLKNGIAIIFYGILFIFGVFTLYGIFKGIVRKILKMMFTEEDQMLTVIGYLIIKSSGGISYETTKSVC